MNKLEYYIIKVFQSMMLKNSSDTQYITIDDNLFAVIKGVEELDLYIKTEVILDGRSLNTFSFDNIDDCLYKVIWNNKFKYLVGSLNSLDTSEYSRELELLKLSENPLSNYLKTL